MKVVSNTTPIISLSSIKRIEILKELFNEIHIPLCHRHIICTLNCQTKGDNPECKALIRQNASKRQMVQ